MNIAAQIRADIASGISYVRYRNWFVTTVIVGTILLNFSYLLVPFLLFLEYLVYGVQYSVGGMSRPPRFHDWGELFTDGVKTSILLIIYVISPTILVQVVISSVFPGVELQVFIDQFNSLFTRVTERLPGVPIPY